MQAARQTLAARWRSALDALESARHEYRALRAVLARELAAPHP